MANLTAHIFEKGDHFYVVTPVVPVELGDQQTEELAFAQDMKRMAPNANLGWLQGRYAEGDVPNNNGQFWASKELEIASLTPLLMPVTVMHDPRTAVGMIADARLTARTEQSAARIDTTLGIWRHRFPETWDEVVANYTGDGLMQSMECLPSFYDCAACERRFPKLPGNAEVATWCEHLKAGEVSAGLTTAVRRLGNVTFTGTGLIFGSRGARGALDAANLEVFQDEVAAFHDKAKRDLSRKPAKPRKGSRTMEVDDKRYEELVAAEQRATTLQKRVDDLEPVAAKVPDLERDKEAAEVAQKAAETARDEEKAAKEQLEESARATTLADERKLKLGDKFLAKLPDSIKTRLDEQARTLKEEDWTARLEELAELTGVKSDEKTEGAAAAGAGAAGTHTAEELARAAVGSGGSGGDGLAQSPEARRAVIGGLAKHLSGAANGDGK